MTLARQRSSQLRLRHVSLATTRSVSAHGSSSKRRNSSPRSIPKSASSCTWSSSTNLASPRRSPLLHLTFGQRIRASSLVILPRDLPFPSRSCSQHGSSAPLPRFTSHLADFTPTPRIQSSSLPSNGNRRPSHPTGPPSTSPPSAWNSTTTITANRRAFACQTRPPRTSASVSVPSRATPTATPPPAPASATSSTFSASATPSPQDATEFGRWRASVRLDAPSVGSEEIRHALAVYPQWIIHNVHSPPFLIAPRRQRPRLARPPVDRRAALNPQRCSLQKLVRKRQFRLRRLVQPPRSRLGQRYVQCP